MGPRWNTFKVWLGDKILPTQIGIPPADRLPGFDVVKDAAGNWISPSQKNLPRCLRMRGEFVGMDKCSGGYLGQMQLGFLAGAAGATVGGLAGGAVAIPIGMFSPDKETAKTTGGICGFGIGGVCGGVVGHMIFPTGLGAAIGAWCGGGCGSFCGTSVAGWSFENYSNCAKNLKDVVPEYAHNLIVADNSVHKPNIA